jgi:hypothetical protein
VSECLIYLLLFLVLRGLVKLSISVKRFWRSLLFDSASNSWSCDSKFNFGHIWKIPSLKFLTVEKGTLLLSGSVMLNGVV